MLQLQIILLLDGFNSEVSYGTLEKKFEQKNLILVVFLNFLIVIIENTLTICEMRSSFHIFFVYKIF